jgi:hypothetical protein
MNFPGGQSRASSLSSDRHLTQRMAAGPQGGKALGRRGITSLGSVTPTLETAVPPTALGADS